MDRGMNNLKVEEQTLIQQINTSEACLMAVLDVVSGGDIEVHKLIVEDILTAIHRIKYELQTELLHVRLAIVLQH
jgi:hypothetical protein